MCTTLCQAWPAAGIAGGLCKALLYNNAQLYIVCMLPEYIVMHAKPERHGLIAALVRGSALSDVRVPRVAIVRELSYSGPQKRRIFLHAHIGINSKIL